MHGAGLMLVPMLLGLCAVPAAGQVPTGAAPGVVASAGIAVAVAVAHTAALVAAGGGLAWVVFRVLGLGFLTRSWFDLSRVWAASLALAGALGIWSAF
jgi:hypothetical protein